MRTGSGLWLNADEKGKVEGAMTLKALRRGRFLGRGLFFVLPLARRELRNWRRRALAIPDPGYRALALSAIHHKAFHSEGGALFAMAAPGHLHRPLTGFIVAVQTISDYLDTVCDRCPSLPAGAPREAFFRAIHRAFVSALRVNADPPDTSTFPVQDHGYLEDLVRTAHAHLSRLPGAQSVSPAMLALANLYSEFQALKHLARPEADERLAAWFEGIRSGGIPPYLTAERLSGLHWWEFGAAAGSTLGIFALALAASRKGHLSAEEVSRIVAGYFPWICAYHILLDYLIDQEEDARGGDLNLVACYPRGTDVIGRLRHLREAARACARPLDPPDLHPLIVAGLTALYATDPKAQTPSSRASVLNLLDGAGVSARILAMGARVSRTAGFFIGPDQPPASPHIPDRTAN